ncbi:MAG: ribosome silencing factor [Elusimicrobia bacterium]|nr:ribosome silencing factor [Elusimicrobiota bacterium]
MPRGFRKLAPLIAQAAEDKKGEDILLFDVHKQSSLTDYLLLVSVLSPAHLHAVEDEISKIMDSAGVEVLHRDGSDSDLWLVLDYGGVMVHLMHPDAREFYAIEKLYHDAPRKQWQAEPASPPRARSRSR